MYFNGFKIRWIVLKLKLLHGNDMNMFDVRDEIARCIEKAYDKIGFHDAYRMLFFTEDTEASYRDYIKEVSLVCWWAR